ncbi:hypothetical protein K450DRAFT_232988 [Umbelopsis ramanniana AG]|uniref:Uncharacterized protein n=1 Tax=Umbelopsis ramanniana AG TaxID=1314678 RepID=A0AAD5EDE5_UMBRA|nr:uncharacterized protein K450DRAFT_232988 [Umbelopsis ramanniana AG]KAI8581424.1 hypothetical protein K450DRAFT_232988 [Umbelopsis ramanniana AG]
MELECVFSVIDTAFIRSYVVDTPTTLPNTSQKAESADVSDDGGPQHLITAAIVVSCVVAVTMIAIFIFRRVKLKVWLGIESGTHFGTPLNLLSEYLVFWGASEQPSHSFKQKLSSRPASFVSPIQHHDAVFLRELQHV